MNHDELLLGVGHVQYEWTQMAGAAARLDLVHSIRTPEENATLEALLLHGRCLVNFLCGGFKGTWMPNDIRPADFLRQPWSLPDDEMDCRLRGRLTIINTHLAHLSWNRVTNKQGVIWPTGLVAHEIHWAMNVFVAAVRTGGVSSLARWEAAASEADRWMPARRDNWAEMRGFEPAATRAAPLPDPIALSDP